MDIIKDHLVAEGPEGLEKILIEMLEKTRVDPLFAQKEHYVLYVLGNQKSLIKVDTKQYPFKFWHYDLMGRPATTVVRETIARFLWEQCGEKQKYGKEIPDKIKV